MDIYTIRMVDVKIFNTLPAMPFEFLLFSSFSDSSQEFYFLQTKMSALYTENISMKNVDSNYLLLTKHVFQTSSKNVNKCIGIIYAKKKKINKLYK
jgi:hypothetical protein